MGALKNPKKPFAYLTTPYYPIPTDQDPHFDKVGNRYGMLLVVKRVKKPRKVGKQSVRYWMCLCDCGKIFPAASSSLSDKHRHTRWHCGCANYSKRQVCWLSYILPRPPRILATREQIEERQARQRGRDQTAKQEKKQKVVEIRKNLLLSEKTSCASSAPMRP